jgi:hypothetical protein
MLWTTIEVFTPGTLNEKLYDVTRYVIMYSTIWAICHQMSDGLEVALYFTNFMNVPRYMMQYYYRPRKDLYESGKANPIHDSFKRDAYVYRAINFWLLAYAFYELNGFSNKLALLVMTVGFLIGHNAFDSLGVEGTYYGYEMRHPKIMSAEFNPVWPYTKDGSWTAPYKLPFGIATIALPTIWEPMYMGQIIAFLGMAIADEFRQKYLTLVVMHVVIYIIAIWQERTQWCSPEHKEKSA